MTRFEKHEEVGDHRLVNIPTALTIVNFNMASTSNSSSDTETDKYFDNTAKTATQFNMVADKDVQITALDGETLTDAIPVDGNLVYAEDRGSYRSITIKTTASDTVISLRVR